MDLLQQSAEFPAGRIAYQELAPLSVSGVANASKSSGTGPLLIQLLQSNTLKSTAATLLNS
jgi:hypothetical protein